MNRATLSTAALLFLAAHALPSMTAHAAQITWTVDPKATCSAIEISGEIAGGDQKKFSETLKAAVGRAPLRRLYLNSAGGDLFTAMVISQLIRNGGLNIDAIVRARNSCNSACVVILAIGARRHVSSDAAVILHQASDSRTGQANTVITKGIGQYLVANGMAPAAADTMAKLKAGETLAVTPANAKRLGFGTLRFYGTTDPPATPQCSWKGFVVRDP